MIPIADKDSVVLRFTVGDRVECNCGTWKAGTIVKLFYVQRNFPEGQCAPYQIQLDDGKLIYAPNDEDRVCRKLEVVDIPMDTGDTDEDIPEEEKLPITIITGFLGAGKTTLVNYILKGDHGKKICIIENEFGAVNIDSDLVQENLNVAEEIISMDNGCACCTVRGDLVRALLELKNKKSKFDWVMLETTGLADPAPILSTFAQHPVVSNHFRVDGIVTLVDSKFIKAHLDEVRPEGTVNEAVQQVAFADKILLNKIDLVSKEELAAVKETIGEINAFAYLIETERSRPPLDKIMNMNAFSLERLQDALDEYEEEEEVCTDENCTVDHAHAHGSKKVEEGHEHGHVEPEQEHGHAVPPPQEHGHAEPSPVEHSHTEVIKKKKKKHDLSSVGSIGLTTEKPLNVQAFNAFMQKILATKSRDLYRSKGVLCFASEGETKFVFQGVHEQIQFNPAQTPWQEGECRVSKVVFIGKNLNRDELEAGFKACEEPETAAKPQGLFSRLMG